MEKKTLRESFFIKRDRKGGFHLKRRYYSSDDLVQVLNFEISSVNLNPERKLPLPYVEIIEKEHGNPIEISRAEIEKLKAEVFAKLKSAEASKEYEETLIQKIQDAAKNRTNSYNEYFEAQNKLNNAIQLLKKDTIHYIDKTFLL